MSLKISRILHAGYVFECESTQILFDPIFENPFSRNCFAFPNVKFDIEQIRALRPDAVFISHYHDDHCSLESLNYLDRSTPIYIFCLHEEMLELIRAVGFSNVHSIQLNVSIVIGSVRVIPRRALDREVDSIFHIIAAGLNILNVVDSWIDDNTLRLLKQAGSWDMILWPFQTMREIEVLSPNRYPGGETGLPSEWLDQLRELNPRAVVPSSCQFVNESWSWYNHAFFPISYRQFETEIKTILPNAQVIRLNPGVAVIVTPVSFSCSSPLSWIQPIGNQNVDYQFQPSLPIPTTASIAAKLPALGKNEADRVYEYCQYELIRKYQTLELFHESYFKKPRIWRLELYDHLGQARLFYYRVQNSDMMLITSSAESVGWRTELPVAKLFGAIEQGESLASMYMRINYFGDDSHLETDVSEELAAADLLEDPLVRCLFEGEFGSYQKAQLVRIKEN